MEMKRKVCVFIILNKNKQQNVYKSKRKGGFKTIQSCMDNMDRDTRDTEEI